jgi:circadian clock protein KaiB
MATKKLLSKSDKLGPKYSKKKNDQLVLRLYVTDETPNCTTALKNLQAICKEELEGKYKIEVIDLLKHPQLGHNHQILAIPTLVKVLPSPLKRVIGDLSDTQKVLVGLDLLPNKKDK